MDIIRNKLTELGFHKEQVGNYPLEHYIYVWKHSEYRNATYYIWITSFSNWNFKFEKAKSGHETGIESYSRFAPFIGNLSSLEDLEVLMRCTGINI